MKSLFWPALRSHIDSPIGYLKAWTFASDRESSDKVWLKPFLSLSLRGELLKGEVNAFEG